MAAAYEALWHAIIVGPVLIFIALVELLATLAGFCSRQVDRFAGYEPASVEHGIEESGVA